MTMSTPRLLVKRRISAGTILRVVIDDFVRADLARARQLLVGACGGKYSRPVQPGNLDGRLSDAAAGAEHQHVFARANPRPRDEHVPGGEKRQRKRRGFDKADRVGQGDDVLAAARARTPRSRRRFAIRARRNAGTRCRGPRGTPRSVRTTDPAAASRAVPPRCRVSDDSTISPATSAPEMCGSGNRTTPRRFQRSRWLSAHARTRTRRRRTAAAGRARLRIAGPRLHRARGIERLS